MSIFTPRSAVTAAILRANKGKHQQMCTKILYKGFEISIAMDSGHGPGDLTRSDIRVYDNEIDVSRVFFADDEAMLYGDADTLLRIMKRIEAGATA